MFGPGSTPSMCHAPHLRNPNMTPKNVFRNCEWIYIGGVKSTLTISSNRREVYMFHLAAEPWQHRGPKPRQHSCDMIGSTGNWGIDRPTDGYTWWLSLKTGFAHGKETRWNFRWLTSGHPTSPENLVPDGSCMTLPYPCASGKRRHEPRPWIGGTVGWSEACKLGIPSSARQDGSTNKIEQVIAESSLWPQQSWYTR